MEIQVLIDDQRLLVELEVEEDVALSVQGFSFFNSSRHSRDYHEKLSPRKMPDINGDITLISGHISISY